MSQRIFHKPERIRHGHDAEFRHTVKVLRLHKLHVSNRVSFFGGRVRLFKRVQSHGYRAVADCVNVNRHVDFVGFLDGCRQSVRVKAQHAAIAVAFVAVRFGHVSRPAFENAVEQNFNRVNVETLAAIFFAEFKRVVNVRKRIFVRENLIAAVHTKFQLAFFVELTVSLHDVFGAVIEIDHRVVKRRQAERQEQVLISQNRLLVLLNVEVVNQVLKINLRAFAETAGRVAVCVADNDTVGNVGRVFGDVFELHCRGIQPIRVVTVINQHNGLVGQVVNH